jgi:hypothetical protein
VDESYAALTTGLDFITSYREPTVPTLLFFMFHCQQGLLQLEIAGNIALRVSFKGSVN